MGLTARVCIVQRWTHAVWLGVARQGAPVHASVGCCAQEAWTSCAMWMTGMGHSAAGISSSHLFLVASRLYGNKVAHGSPPSNLAAESMPCSAAGKVQRIDSGMQHNLRQPFLHWHRTLLHFDGCFVLLLSALDVWSSISSELVPAATALVCFYCCN